MLCIKVTQSDGRNQVRMGLGDAYKLGEDVEVVFHFVLIVASAAFWGLEQVCKGTYIVPMKL